MVIHLKTGELRMHTYKQILLAFKKRLLINICCFTLIENTYSTQKEIYYVRFQLRATGHTYGTLIVFNGG